MKDVDEQELLFLKDNFICIRCAECCKMKVVINNYDIKKIEKLGYKGFYEKDVLGRTVLKIVDNYCIFLKNNGDCYYCEVYEAKPKGCENFPFFNNLVMECPSLDKLFFFLFNLS